MMYNSQSGTVTPMEFKSYPIIPLVYGQSLSYMEMVAKCCDKINEVIDKLNGVTTEAVEQSKQYTDNAIKELYGDIEKAVSDVNKTKEELNQEYLKFVNLINSQITLFRGELDDIHKDVEIGITGANSYTNFAINQNNEYLLSELGKGLKDIKVINYFTGESISVQNMFDYLAQFHLDNAITFSELSELSKTYNELVASNSTYTNLVLNGATLF